MVASHPAQDEHFAAESSIRLASGHEPAPVATVVKNIHLRGHCMRHSRGCFAHGMRCISSYKDGVAAQDTDIPRQGTYPGRQSSIAPYRDSREDGQ